MQTKPFTEGTFFVRSCKYLLQTKYRIVVTCPNSLGTAFPIYTTKKDVFSAAGHGSNFISAPLISICFFPGKWQINDLHTEREIVICIDGARIFIDMIAPKIRNGRNGLARYINLHLFPSGTFVIPIGMKHNIYTPSRLVIVLFCVHAPRAPFRVSFCPTHLPSATETSILLHFLACAEIIFAHILVSPRVRVQ